MRLATCSARAGFIDTFLILTVLSLGPALVGAGSPETPSPGVGTPPPARSPVTLALDGKLVILQNGAAVAAAIQGDPEYFVLYHSASW